MSAQAVRWTAPDLSSGASAGTMAPPPQARPGPSVEELAAIEKAAREEGLAAGRADGFAQGQTEVRRLCLQLEGVLAGFAKPLEQLDGEVEAVLGTLAVRIAGHLLGRAYEADPSLLAELVQTALAEAGAAVRAVEVHLQPQDLKLIQDELTLPDGVKLVADNSLKRGELRVHSEQLRIDGRLAARIEAALASLGPMPASEDPS